MQIRWSPEAADDLAQIGRRIQKENPGAAREVVLELYRSCTGALPTFECFQDEPVRGELRARGN